MTRGVARSSGEAKLPMYSIPRSRILLVDASTPSVPLSIEWLVALLTMSTPAPLSASTISGGELNAGYPDNSNLGPATGTSMLAVVMSAFSMYFFTGANIGAKS
ncbi:hypothetical protein M3A74_09710 [Corynebacterium appendicis]|nr:hypothetical protein [Corynebacterium appendicis]MCT1685075.1 hypothetical protein [Corynebacterium appendicis]